MTSVITGDIIKSRAQNKPESWLNALKAALTHINPNAESWEIYRGDSFQIEIKDWPSSFECAVYIKSCIKYNSGLDVRLAIGVGNKTYQGEKVTESNGEAFILSGEALETLKKEKQNLLIKTNNASLNKELNLYFKLASIAMDHWTKNSAEIVKLSLENPDALQQHLGQHIGISQDAVSKRQKRAYLAEILELNQMYRHKLTTL
ncbi:SatD family protein [Aestuariibaculum sediminum]|uniref:Transcriptional regulator n=1 Tax=Aestuariibaculum sediminum TaxID=2770637 RepID=A0A8J6U7R6_9FLAO|nr:SatD family protein [Aestuariibaculum sediminum]MBD0832288.1 transcriptional regulator [Aestuariibaculum sediminum]